MRINETIVESEQLEEKWKQNIAAAALAAVAALGGGYSGDAAASDNGRPVTGYSQSAARAQTPVITDFRKLMEAATYLAHAQVGHNGRFRMDNSDQARYNYGLSIVQASMKLLSPEQQNIINRVFNDVASRSSGPPPSMVLDNLDSVLRSAARAPQSAQQSPGAQPQAQQPAAQPQRSAMAIQAERDMRHRTALVKKANSLTGEPEDKLRSKSNQEIENIIRTAEEHKRQELAVANLKDREAPKVKLSSAEQAYLDSLNATANGGQKTSASTQDRITSLQEIVDREAAVLKNSIETVARVQDTIKKLKTYPGNQARVAELEDGVKQLTKSMENSRNSIEQTKKTIAAMQKEIDDSYAPQLSLKLN
jgi:hypothetical protein